MRFTYFFTLFICANALFGMSVVSVSPSPNSMEMNVAPLITIEFDTEIDLTSFPSSSVNLFGRWSGPMMATVSFSSGTTISIEPTENFFRGEWVSVYIADGFTGTDGLTLEGGFTFGFWTSTLPGSLDLTDTEHISVRLPGETFIQSYGAYAGDLNHDGWSDLAVVNENSGDLRIFYNDNGQYTDFTLFDLPLGDKPSSNEGTDFNGDGEIDLVIGNTQGDMVSVVMGNGTGGFGAETTYDSFQGVRGVAVIDLDGDGDMDIASANRIGNNIALFHNDGTGNFGAAIPIGIATSGETGIVAGDMNNDGWTDLIVGSYNSSEVIVLLNDGSGEFTISTMIDSGNGLWMLTLGDVNGDGNIDITTANAASNNIGILLGDGTGQLSAATYYSTGGFPLAIDLGDLDGDGDLDVVSSNYSGLDFTLYENNGAGEFINPRTYEAEAAGSCAIFHDRNNDGVMDMTGVDEIQDILIIFENFAVGLDENELLELSVYPNPFARSFSIYSDRKLDANAIDLVDLSGKKILGMTITQSGTTMQISVPEMLSSGCYFLISPTGEFRNVKLLKY